MKLTLICALSVCWAVTSFSAGQDQTNNAALPWGPEMWESIKTWHSATNWHSITIGMTKKAVLVVFKDAIPRDQWKARLSKGEAVSVSTVRPSDSELQTNTWMVMATTGIPVGPAFEFGRINFADDKVAKIEVGKVKR